MDEWERQYQAELETLLSVVALSDDFWGNVEPKFAAQATFGVYRHAIMRLPVLRQHLTLQAVDASCWDGIKRRWLPDRLQRIFIPHVRCFDINEITSPNGKVTRYLLRTDYLTQKEWGAKLRRLMAEEHRAEQED
ncbi:MAG TPA: hypothetical protein VMW79_10820 [Anaerolineae bacterium]|nr:hypothetical protein [Anaerolineae bacterium]